MNSKKTVWLVLSIIFFFMSLGFFINLMAGETMDAATVITTAIILIFVATLMTLVLDLSCFGLFYLLLYLVHVFLDLFLGLGQWFATVRRELQRP